MKLFNWIGRALSENGNPSSKRLFGFLFVLTMCIGIIYKVFVAHDLPTYILYPTYGVILLLTGVATLPQLIKLWRGGNVTDDKKDTAE
jgi:hypothetical protein